MRGSIYSEQKCLQCGKSLKHDDRKRGLFCTDHPEQEATKRFYVKFGCKVRKRFNTYREAERFLDGLRYEVDKGTFDHRDYLASNPLSFTVLSNHYIEKKQNSWSAGTYSHYKRYFEKAQEFFGNTSVKQIGFAQLEDFADSLSAGNKTKSCYLDAIKTFYRWLVKRKEIDKGSEPEFPEIKYELGYRRTIDKETQLAIVDRVRVLSEKVSPRIWVGIKLLTTYISIRPAEMRDLKEGDIDLEQGIIFIPHPKEKRPKIVPLTSEDIRLLRSFPQGLPDLYFFRYTEKASGVTPGSRFGKNLFYKWWKRACDDLGVQDVDLYGGTRHSTTISLRQFHSPEQIKRATMHSTNKAFERYFKVSRSELQSVYEDAQGTTRGPRKKGLHKT